ncbi:radical SAM protein [Sandaracinus amylolyticus]|uniref:Radical SAM core domain-containing protein n=1 Tax=Sandaracinus amylolyticus TaxID=927083 RepID=A0A0F6SE74_9BACT|nr:radical SAM protein [Sandaracinus amylolyticus]AKF04699.1 hypothetical protein DB32_001848 [Sandaracinus amylolyticus]
MSAVARNLATVEPLVRRLPFAISSLEASETEPAVDLRLDTPGGTVKVRVGSREGGTKALAYTRSFAISYLPSAGDPLSRAALDGVVSFARKLAALDPGGLALLVPTPTEPAPRRLPVVPRIASGSWSRATFDRGIDAVRAKGRRIDRAVLVVTQSCEMACTFCPSRDKQHEVHPDVDERTYFDDLVHQMRAARSLGARVLEVGGNDVLRFSRAAELFERAGALGFEEIIAQSPGQRLADEAFARTIASGPLTRVEIPLYGARAEVHDAVTGAPGSFDTLCRALDVALALGRPRVVLRTLALRSTLAHLGDLFEFADRRFGLRLTVRMLWPNRLGEREHLVDAVPFPELDDVMRRHADRFDPDLPLCVFPGAHAGTALRALESIAGIARVHLWDLGIVDGSEDARQKRDREHLHVAACDACAVRDTCVGVLRAHLDAFGDAGLRPFASRPA